MTHRTSTMKILTLKLHSLIALMLFFTCPFAKAAKYDFLFGMYSYSAQVSNKTTSLSGLGSYEAAYLVPFKDYFELNLGYSFTMTGIIGGDYSYGPKLGLNFFPWNFSSNEKVIIANKSVEIHDFFKPYVGIAFNQRQFQSAKASFAGFGVSIGCEKYLNSKFTLKSEVKMNTYSGASEAKSKETNILLGLVMGY